MKAPKWAKEVAAADERIARADAPRIEKAEVPGREVEAVVTDHGVKGNNWGSVPFTRTIQAKVRTRLVYEGRPMFLAADPVAKPEEVAS